MDWLCYGVHFFPGIPEAHCDIVNAGRLMSPSSYHYYYYYYHYDYYILMTINKISSKTIYCCHAIQKRVSMFLLAAETNRGSNTHVFGALFAVLLF